MSAMDQVCARSLSRARAVCMEGGRANDDATRVPSHHPQLCGNAELFNHLFLATGIIGSAADVVHLGR